MNRIAIRTTRSDPIKQFTIEPESKPKLAPGGRIRSEVVSDEIDRLCQPAASSREAGDDDAVLGPLLGKRLAQLDLFDRVQLAAVVRTCRGSRSLSEAGWALFAVSRGQRTAANDADRLRKYLARFGLSWDAVASL